MAKENGKSLPDLLRQIAELQAQAEKARDREKADVIGRMLEAIEVYNIGPGELFGRDGKAKRGDAGRAAAKAARAAKAPTAKAPAAKAKPAKKTKRRVRRVFTDEDRAKLLAEHRQLVEQQGLTFDAASKKMGLAHSLLHLWYKAAGQERPQRAA